MHYGYARVSTAEQNEERQIIALKNAGAEKIYTEKQSGKDFKRPVYLQMIRRLKDGDLLTVQSLDRLGRNYEEIQEQWRFLTKQKKVDIVVLDMPLLDTRRGKDLLGTFLSDIVLQVLSFVAETERRNIRERQRQGIDAALARGVHFGKPGMKLPDGFDEAVRKREAGELTWVTAAQSVGMNPSTFRYRALQEKKKRSEA